MWRPGGFTPSFPSDSCPGSRGQMKSSKCSGERRLRRSTSAEPVKDWSKRVEREEMVETQAANELTDRQRAERVRFEMGRLKRVRADKERREK